MINFSLFNTYNITPNDEIILLGMKMNYFSLDVAKDYIYWKMGNNIPTSEVDISIVDCSENEAVIELLTIAGISPTDDTKRTLRYIVLRGLLTTGDSLLHDIESVYADFDYPEDMEPFIYYMPYHPMDDDAAIDDKKQILINRYNRFLESEARYINSL